VNQLRCTGGKSLEISIDAQHLEEEIHKSWRFLDFPAFELRLAVLFCWVPPMRIYAKFANEQIYFCTWSTSWSSTLFESW